MPSADAFEWPQGQPLFEVMWRSVTESLAGNGIVNNGDFEVTATATALQIQVAAGTYFYISSNHTLGAAETHTLSAGDGSNDRWDTVYLDTATDTTGVREGTPAADPEPPDVQADEAPLAFVYVAQNASDVVDADILNWRAEFSNEAEEVHYDDGTGVYGVNNVDAALDELQEAAQITAYPLAIADLANPYGLPVISDMDVAGTDLTDAGTVLYDSANTWFRNEVVQALANFTADEQFGSYPLPIGDLNSPFALPSITDMDAAGNDLSDSSGPGTLYSASAGEFGRNVLDDEKASTTVSSSTYTTSDEEIVYVDTSAIGAASTITLASADAEDGHGVVVVDLSGAAESNPITIDTEGSETVNGGSSVLIETNYGARRLESDGTNWVTAGGGSGSGGIIVEENGSVLVDPATAINFRNRLDVTDDGDDTVTVDAGGDPNEEVRMNESGNVGTASGDVVFSTQVPDGATFEVRQAGLLLVDGTAAPTDLDLVIATLDNAGAATKQDTVIDGDGTVQNDVTGAGVGIYANSTGGAQTVALIVDNGQFNAGSGSAQDYVTEAVGEVHTGSSTLLPSQLEVLRANETGSVSNGNSGAVAFTQLPDGATFEVRQAGLLLSDGQPAPTDLDLVIATLDNAGGATLQTVVIDGDGTVQNDVTGSPVASYTNSSGGEQTVALLVDNGNFNAGTGSAQSIVTEAIAEVVV